MLTVLHEVCIFYIYDESIDWQRDGCLLVWCVYVWSIDNVYPCPLLTGWYCVFLWMYFVLTWGLTSVMPWDCLIKYTTNELKHCVKDAMIIIIFECCIWHQQTRTHTQTRSLTADSWKSEKNTNQRVKRERGLSQRSWMSLGPCPGDHLNLNKCLQSALWAGKQPNTQERPWKIRGSEKGFTISVTSVWCSLVSFCSNCLSN